MLVNNLHFSITHYQLRWSPYLLIFLLFFLLKLRFFIIFQELLQLLLPDHSHNERIILILVIRRNSLFLFLIILYAMAVHFGVEMRGAVKHRMEHLPIAETHLAEKSALRRHRQVSLLRWNPIKVIHHVSNRVSFISLHWRVKSSH